MNYEYVSSKLSHDMRALCRHIQLYADLLGESDPFESSDHVEKIKQKTTLLSSAIKSGRQLALIEARSIHLSHADARNLITSAIKNASDDHFGLQLSIEGDAKLHCDVVLFSLAVQHLCDNAVIHSAGKPELNVRLSTNEIAFASTSSRPSSENDFEAFQSSSEQRWGLGLSIARRAVERFGGSLVSEAVDVGAYSLRMLCPKAETTQNDI